MVVEQRVWHRLALGEGTLLGERLGAEAVDSAPAAASSRAWSRKAQFAGVHPRARRGSRPSHPGARRPVLRCADRRRARGCPAPQRRGHGLASGRGQADVRKARAGKVVGRTVVLGHGRPRGSRCSSTCLPGEAVTLPTSTWGDRRQPAPAVEAQRALIAVHDRELEASDAELGEPALDGVHQRRCPRLARALRGGPTASRRWRSTRPGRSCETRRRPGRPRSRPRHARHTRSGRSRRGHYSGGTMVRPVQQR